MNKKTKHHFAPHLGGGGYPLTMAAPGESVVVLCCNTRDPDLNRHLSDMGISPSGVLQILCNENGRLTVLSR